jgi:hypothetical protein
MQYHFFVTSRRVACKEENPQVFANDEWRVERQKTLCRHAIWAHENVWLLFLWSGEAVAVLPLALPIDHLVD